MKCKFCGKNIDEIDTSCSMCTICGWTIEAIVPNPEQGKAEPEAAPLINKIEK